MKALIFSAGKGTRLKPFTNQHPKALAKVNNIPLLERNIKYLQSFGINDFVINIQGDEPLIDIESINVLANNYRSEKSEIITLKQEIKSQKEIENPNHVKVIADFNDNAIYFSRSVIPYERNKNADFKYFRHIGIYGYTTSFLNKLKNLKEGVLEKIESLEQLRFIENGYKIKVLETKSNVIGVDTEEDLREVVKFIKENGIKLE